MFGILIFKITFGNRLHFLSFCNEKLIKSKQIESDIDLNKDCCSRFGC